MLLCNWYVKAFRSSQTLQGMYRQTYVYQHLQAKLNHYLLLPVYFFSESGGTGAYSSLNLAQGNKTQKKKCLLLKSRKNTLFFYYCKYPFKKTEMTQSHITSPHMH